MTLVGLLVAVFGMGADCTEGDIGESSDAGGGWDSEVADGTESCSSAATTTVCRRRSGCQWLTATCDGGTVVSGCFPASAGPTVPVSCSPDAGAVGDAGAYDVGMESPCGRFDDGGTCDAQPRCWWWAPRCGEGVGQPRCLPEGALPADPPECSGGDADLADAGRPVGDAGSGRDGSTDGSDVGHQYLDAGPGSDAGSVSCSNVSAQSSCEQVAGCKWWSANCHGTVVSERCVPNGMYPTPPKCKTIQAGDCYKLKSQGQCGGPNCEWVTGGCGQPSVGTVEVNACLPSGNCRSNGDCPTNHLCTTVWLKPCEGSACRSCGMGVNRCVPTGLLKP